MSVPKYVGAGFLTQPLAAIAAGKTGEPEVLTSGGVKASGRIVFSNLPAADSTITINGTAFTFKASGATGNQINIGASVSATIDNVVTVLNASAVAGVALATYSKTGAGDDNLTVVFDAPGTAGNAFTLAAGAGSNGTAGSATLSNGVATEAVSLETEPSRISLSQAADQYFTLGAGDEAQRKLIYMSAKGGAGSAVVSAPNLSSGTTLTFDAVGKYADLRFMNGKWVMVAGTATAA